MDARFHLAPSTARFIHKKGYIHVLFYVKHVLPRRMTTAITRVTTTRLKKENVPAAPEPACPPPPLGGLRLPMLSRQASVQRRNAQPDLNPVGRELDSGFVDGPAGSAPPPPLPLCPHCPRNEGAAVAPPVTPLTRLGGVSGTVLNNAALNLLLPVSRLCTDIIGSPGARASAVQIQVRPPSATGGLSSWGSKDCST